jgi:hypothetical protein
MPAGLYFVQDSTRSAPDVCMGRKLRNARKTINRIFMYESFSVGAL